AHLLDRLASLEPPLPLYGSLATGALVILEGKLIAIGRADNVLKEIKAAKPMETVRVSICNGDDQTWRESDVLRPIGSNLTFYSPRAAPLKLRKSNRLTFM